MNAHTKTPPTTFSEAFLKMQMEIRPAIKDANNPAFRSKYADLNSVWEAIREPLHNNGFFVVQTPDFDGEQMWLTTTIQHISGDFKIGRYPLRPIKQDMQGYGSAISYARRYSLSAMLGVISEDDDDGNAASTPAPKPQAAQAAAPKPMVHQNPDVVKGNRVWIDQEKQAITACERLPDMYMWLDENGESWSEPTSGSNLWKTRRSCPEHFEEIKAHYLNKMAELNKGGK